MNISASPTSIAYSGASNITWSSTNATSCRTPWGSTATGGTYTTPALTGSMSYSVSCSGVGGVGSGMTTIAVGSPPLPILSLTASPSSVTYSGTSLIVWSSTNATSCVTPWGSTATGGTYTTPALTGSVSYSVSCSGVGGSVNGRVSIGISTGNLPLGTLIHDGPATPEQLSLYLPVTGPLPQTAVATVQYKKTNSSTWITGHPLFRIQPGYDADLSASGNSADAFAWPLIGMTPGATYNIEVTVTSSGISDIKTLTHTTRALPPAAGTPNKIITAGSTNAQIIAVLATLNPGDVLEFKNGTYNVSGISINQRDGTVSSPIYIRGESRDGVILKNPTGTIIQVNSSNIIIENMTLQGPAIDSGVNSDSRGIVFYSGNIEAGVTIRNVTITGVDIGIKSYNEINGILIYNNTLIGNNTWNQDLYAYNGGGAPGAGDGIPDIDQNLFWNDDGICAAGHGNVAFNNTLSGFGDAFAFAWQDNTTAIGVHFYRNEVRNSGDDLLEADYGRRNVSFYDNRSHNSMTALSLDPIKGGPLLYARNIVINAGRTPFKWNSANSGQFVLDNTIVRTARGAT